jgi:hypothetical protein
MATISSLYDEEGWTPNPRALDTPASIPYYFAVFRDATERKLLGVRQAAQFKGVISKRLIRLLDDSLTMIEDRVFKLDNDFDFLVTAQHVYILRPAGFERIAQVEKFASAKAREKTLALGGQVTFVDFEALADFVAGHKRAARLVAALSARAGLNEIQKSRFRLAAADTGVTLQNVGRKIRPAPGSEMPFLELLDDRRYTTAIKTGPKEAYVASSRKPISRPT